MATLGHMVSTLPPEGLETTSQPDKQCVMEPSINPGSPRLWCASLGGNTPSMLSQIYGGKVRLPTSRQEEDSGSSAFGVFPGPALSLHFFTWLIEICMLSFNKQNNCEYNNFQ